MLREISLAYTSFGVNSLFRSTLDHAAVAEPRSLGSGSQTPKKKLTALLEFRC
jgi:hypothetical protein